jgi:5-methylcytosine-specific restriction protein A
LRLRRHFRRDRNQRVVELKKAKVLQEQGRLACEACSFDFAAVYGELGEGVAECHHRKPLGELIGRTVTRLEDLAIICANCHRILHLPKAQGLTVEQLAARLGR